MIDLDPSCLRAFTAVVDEGGFTRAAQRLNRTQSAVSMQIRRLEEMLGGQLFNDRKKVTLTPVGERVLEHARRIVTLNDELLGRAKGLDVTGRVRIGAPDDYIAFFLPTILRRLSITHPQIEVEVRCNMSTDLVPAVDRGNIDIALVTRLPGLSDGTTVRREPLVWVAANDEVARRRPLPLALFSPGCPFRDAAVNGLETVNIPCRVAYESHSIASIGAAVSEGLAVAAMVQISMMGNMKILDGGLGLPKLPLVDICLYGPRGVASPAVQAVKLSIMEGLTFGLADRVAA